MWTPKERFKLAPDKLTKYCSSIMCNGNQIFCFAEVVSKGTENMFWAATAGSFFTQVMPKESIDFGLCLTAAHMLSKRY